MLLLCKPNQSKPHLSINCHQHTQPPPETSTKLVVKFHKIYACYLLNIYNFTMVVVNLHKLTTFTNSTFYSVAILVAILHKIDDIYQRNHL